MFPAGTASASIDVEIVVDDLKEEDEQFRVVLTGSEGCVFAEGFQEAIGTIRNDDSVLATPQGGTRRPRVTQERRWFGLTNSTAQAST